MTPWGRRRRTDQLPMLAKLLRHRQSPMLLDKVPHKAQLIGSLLQPRISPFRRVLCLCMERVLVEAGVLIPLILQTSAKKMIFVIFLTI